MNDNTLYLSCLCSGNRWSEFPFLHFQQTKFLVRAIVRTSMFHDEYLKNRSEKEVVVFTSWLLLTTSGSGRILASSYGLTRSNPESVVVLNVLKGPQTYGDFKLCYVDTAGRNICRITLFWENATLTVVWRGRSFQRDLQHKCKIFRIHWKYILAQLYCL